MAAFAVTTAFGGFGTMQDGAVPRVSPGQRVQASYMSTTVQAAFVANALPWTDSRDSQGRPRPVEADPGVEFLAIAAHMTNRWHRAQADNAGYLSVHGVRGLADSGEPKVVYQRGDASPYGPAQLVLQPGLGTDVAFVWQVPVGSVHAGDHVEVVVNTMDRLEDTKIGYGGTFLSPYPVATVSVLVGDMP